MWTESGAWQAKLVALTVVVAVGVGAAAGASGQTQPEAPWRDADEASRQLADAQLRVVEARDALAAAKEELAGLRVSTDSNADETLAVADELVSTQERARALVVEAYISGGALNDIVYVLDSPSANDFAFRTTLLSEGAEAVARTQTDYFALAETASQNALDLAGQIEARQRSIDRLEHELADAEVAVPDTEWVLTIAEIHRRADEQMLRWGRTEPTAEQWDDLRFCESTRNYQINTGNSFYGAYQFNLITWVDMGGIGLPSDAPSEEQDARARYLYALRGSGYDRGGAWPVCGRFLPR